MKDIRQELGRLTSSKIVQLLLTLITGKALDNQALPKFTAWGSFARAMTTLAVGVGLACYGTAAEQLVLLPLAWLLSVHAMRYLQLVVVHNASHWAFVKDKAIDGRVGFWVSAILLIENFEKYRPAHFQHHHWKKLSTQEDSTVEALEQANLKVGYSVNRLVLNLTWALVSPAYHVKTSCRRVASYFVNSSLQAKLAASLVLALLGLWTWRSEEVWVVTLVWVLPVTVIYQQAALLRLVVEHNWDEYSQVRESLPAATALTDAIFLGVEPPFGKNVLHWNVWVIRMLLNLAIRLVILPGDSGAAHDYHHQHPRGDWPNYIAERRKAVNKNPEKYSEVWGYWTALVRTLRSISAQPKRSK